MRHTIRSAFWALGVLAVTASGCGGGSSSSSGPSVSAGGGPSAAVIQGQVVASASARTGESLVRVAIRRAFGVRLAEAVTGTPVAGATITLSGASGTFTTLSDANGGFVFQDVPPGSYTLEVATGNPPVVVATTAIVVGAGDQAVVGVVTGSGTPPTVTVQAVATDVFNSDAQLGHAANIAATSVDPGCDTVAEVAALREQRLGWGVIAQRCGVSPGILGLGRSNVSDDELADLRATRGKSAGKGKKA